MRTRQGLGILAATVLTAAAGAALAWPPEAEEPVALSKAFGFLGQRPGGLAPIREAGGSVLRIRD